MPTLDVNNPCVFIGGELDGRRKSVPVDETEYCCLKRNSSPDTYREKWIPAGDVRFRVFVLSDLPLHQAVVMLLAGYSDK